MQEIEKRNKELLEEVEKLKRQVKILKAKKNYGLVWEEEKEPEQIILDCQVKIPILKEVKNKEIISDKQKSVNILIEGNNYHALSVLNYTHRGKIDVIYIDPPYNTGNGDTFRYNDNIVNSEDSFRHSKWLSFMYKRLNLAKNLMKNTGIIFISIDENEFAQLKLLCDEIFREENLVAIHVWRKVVGGKSQGKISTQHEYILTYAKNKSALKVASLPLGEHILKKYRYEDERGKYDLRELGQGKGLSYSESLYYELKAPDGTTISKPPKDKGYRWSKEKWQWGLKQNPPFCMIKKVKDRWVPFVKQYLDYDNEGNKIERGIWPHTWLDDHGFTRTGTKNLDDLLGEGKFEHPKPVKLIKYLINLHPNKSCIVLDFFVGSGTTSQAVLELNHEDKGSRKFVVCTNNENNICSEVCYPRIKKVIQNIEKESKNKLVKNMPGNLKYFKTELLDIDHISHVSDEQKIKLTYQAGEMIALREGAFIEVEKDEWWQIFKDGTKYTAIYFKEDKQKLNELIKKLSKLKEKVVLYIFSWGKNEYKNEFTEYKNIKVEDIPEPIIDVYKEVNRLS